MNSQKNNLIQKIAQFQQQAIRENREISGQKLPCHVIDVKGAIVTVQFDILPGELTLPEITIPVFGPEYIRYPIQKGDKGVTVEASVSLRGISGLGTGIADMSMMPSLTALYFMPLGNAYWPEENPDKLTMYGPAGVIAKTASGNASIDVDDSGIALRIGDTSIMMTGSKITLSAGGDTLEIGAGLKHNGTNIGDTHRHGGVSPGGSTTQGPQ